MSEKMFRWLLVTSLALAVMWSGYWAAASYLLQQAPNAAFAQAKRVGIETNIAQASVSGFPDQFQLRLSEVQAEMDGRTTWDTSAVTLHAASHRPNDLRLDLSEPHRIVGMFGQLDVSSEKAQVNVVLHPRWTLPLAEINFEANMLRVAHDIQAVTVEWALARLLQYSDAPGVYYVESDLIDIRLAGLIAELPETYHAVPLLQIKGDLVFDAAWDRSLVSSGTPQLRAIVLQQAHFMFGEADISATGRLSFTEDLGFAGNVQFTVKEWRSLFQLVSDLGYVDPDLEDFFLRILTDIAALSGSEDTLTLPLSVENGAVSYGAFKLGMLP